MKKAFLGFMVLAALVSANYSWYWDFDRAKAEGLPPMYLFGRQENTYNGFLQKACFGSGCGLRGVSVINL